MPHAGVVAWKEEAMKLPAEMSWRDAGTAILVVLAVALFLVCAYFMATNF